MKVSVIKGDISKVKSDALITCVNSGGMWWGGIDRVIQSEAGMVFHSQINVQNKVTLARGNGKTNFDNVIFVIDDLEKPTKEIVETGLYEACLHRFETVTLPAIRLGVMSGAFEPREDTIDAILKTLRSWNRAYPTNATVVLYDIDPKDFKEKK